jgi:hypothetical protein
LTSPRLDKRTVGKVTYFYDPFNDVIKKEVKDYSHVHSGDEGPVTRLLENVVSLKFRYYFYDKEYDKYFWLDEWTFEYLPLAVMTELEFDDGKTVTKFSNAVTIPLGGEREG